MRGRGHKKKGVGGKRFEISDLGLIRDIDRIIELEEALSINKQPVATEEL